jgi:flavin reductase (DIM6/NTAB) family NADH-FMN oxidoreductase RutF
MIQGVTDSTVVEPATMRQVMGQFCSGITIVTAILHGEPVGFTCQSFASLSLAPAMVSFAPSRASTSWPRVRQAPSFCVNVLSEEHVEISNAFARPGTDKFADVEWRPSRYGAPIIASVAAYVDAQVWAEYDGGDHTIVAARVLDLGADSSRLPLLFHRGQYAGLRRKPDAA